MLSVDRDVLDLRLAVGVVEPLEVPVDQGPEGEQELADQARDLLLELARRGPAQPVEENEQAAGSGVRPRGGGGCAPSSAPAAPAA